MNINFGFYGRLYVDVASNLIVRSAGQFPSVNCLLYKHEELNSKASIRVKRLGQQCTLIISTLSLGVVARHRKSPRICWPPSPADSVKILSQKFKNKNQKDREITEVAIRCCPLACTYAHKHTHTCSSMSIHTKTLQLLRVRGNWYF